MNTSGLCDSLNLIAKYNNNNNQIDSPKTNIIYEAENKENSIIIYNEESKILNNYETKEESSQENKEYTISRSLIQLQLAFKKFLATKKKNKLIDEKVKF